MSKQKFFPAGNPKPIYGKIDDYVKEEKREGKRKNFFTICPSCGAIRENKRWYWDPEIKESKRKEYTEVMCEGCKAVENEFIEGEVTLKNKVLAVVPDQIQNMIFNIEEESRHDNPKHRVVKIKKNKSLWKVYTTSGFLAKRIGDELEKAYNSKTTYKFAKDEKYTTVTWE